MKLKPGDETPPVTATTIRGDQVAIPDPSSGFVHLQFRRFACCPVCNFHLHSLCKAAHYGTHAYDNWNAEELLRLAVA
jgi:hypothetical protein